LRRSLDIQRLAELVDEFPGGADADGHGADPRLLETARQPLTGGGGDFRVQADVGVRLRQAQQIVSAGPGRGHHVDVDTQAVEETADFPHVVPAAEAERARPEQINAGARLVVALKSRSRRRDLALQQRAHQAVKGFAGAPVLLPRVGQHFHGHNGNGQAAAGRQRAGLILQQFRGAGVSHQQHLRLVTLAGVAQRFQDQVGGITAEIPCLECGVGNRDALTFALDHGEQQVGVGVTLGRVQHQVHATHGVGDADGADMRRAFVSPERQLHIRPPAWPGGPVDD
jgi:hypothetical protein